MTRYITEYKIKCQTCKKTKVTKHTKTKKLQSPINASDRVVVDPIGPLPKSDNGNEYAVTPICDLTKYLTALPMSTKSANIVTKAIFESFRLKTNKDVQTWVPNIKV